MQIHTEKLQELMACPVCRTPLRLAAETIHCPGCQRAYAYRNGRWYFDTAATPAQVVESPANRLKDWFKKWPRFYYFILRLFGPVWYGGVGAREFLSRHPGTALTLNVGSGPTDLGNDVINIDLFPYESVAIVADITRLPFKDGAVGRIVCDNVLEHVADPQQVVGEFHRVLGPGGTAYICVPWLFPFHSSPYDYNRWTRQGLERLFANFSISEFGVRSGIFSALTSLLCYLTATIFSFGSQTVYWFLVNASIFIFFPIKFLDIIANHLPFASNAAAEVYLIVQKKS